jgi:hypothetical protein
MTIKCKSAIRTHSIPCGQEDAINHLVDSNNKLSIIITGNGDPEKGISRRVTLIGERQGALITTLDGIKEELKAINENHNVLLGEITRVGSDFVGFKNKVEGIDMGRKEREDVDRISNRDTWYKILTIAGLAIAIFFGIKNNKHGEKMLDEQTTQQSEIRSIRNDIPYTEKTRSIDYNNIITDTTKGFIKPIK